MQRILVRGPNWLGDAVMCEPALRSLKRLFPQAAVTLLVAPSVAGLFERHPSVDRLMLYEDSRRHAGLSGKWRLAGELRRGGFDLAVLFQNAFEAALLAAAADSPAVWLCDGWAHLVVIRPVAKPDRHKVVHQVQYYWDMLKPLGLTGEPVSPELVVSPQEEEAMAGRLKQVGITTEDVLIGVNPGSTYGGAKRWFPERFADAAERLCRRLNGSGRRAAVVLLGARGEEPLGRAIASHLTAPTAVLSGSTIRELMAATKRCTLLVTNDTGPMHIAAAFGVPVVAIFGPTDWRTTSPFGVKHALVRHPVECAPCCCVTVRSIIGAWPA